MAEATLSSTFICFPRLHSPGPSSHPPLRQKSVYSVIINTSSRLDTGCVSLVRGDGCRRAHAERLWSKTARALRGANCPSAPVSPQKGDIVTFAPEMTAASLHHALIPSLSPLAFAAAPPPHLRRQTSRSYLLWEIQSLMIIRYSSRKKATGYKNNNNIDNNVKMLVLIMITLLMSFSHFLFGWYFNNVLISVVSVVAAGQRQKVRVPISRFSASYSDTFLHSHVCFFSV